MFSRLNFALLSAVILSLASPANGRAAPDSFSHFIGFTNFSSFTHSHNTNGETVWVSPEIDSTADWNELIVSWNAPAITGSFVRVEAGAVSDHQTKFYTMASWSPDNAAFPRTSVSGQKDADGDVKVDTLALNHPAHGARVRITLGGTNVETSALKFIGLSFCNTAVAPAALAPNRAAWGKIISTPERSQHGYPDEKGWCSPTALSMVLARWSEVLHEPVMNLEVPAVAAAVYDRGFAGTGNWPFNTAFAGSFRGMRGYVTRLDDLAEIEDWIAAGIPVILSARWDWLAPGRPVDTDGHLIVCIGFTDTGDVVVNDPATRLVRGEPVRRIYKRETVLHAWIKSRHAVYLVYPETASIPEDRFGHWARLGN